MLRLFECHRVKSEVNGGLAIKVKRGRRRHTIPKIIQKVPGEECLAAGKSGSKNFSLSSGGRNRLLATGPPLNGTAAISYEAATYGIINAPTSIAVDADLRVVRGER